MKSQFVILQHRHGGSEHWDLMLERGDVLLTWQLPAEPTGPGSLPMSARRIGDHRKAYLTYEGPISRDRGEVRRIDHGDVDWLDITTSRYVLDLSGHRLRGRFILTKSEEGWCFDVL